MTKVSVSVSIFETIFIKSQSQSQNLIPILKVSVSVSKIETGYTESQSQSQHAKSGLAHPWCSAIFISFVRSTLPQMISLKKHETFHNCDIDTDY